VRVCINVEKVTILAVIAVWQSFAPQSCMVTTQEHQ